MRADELYNYTFAEFLALSNDDRELYKAFGLRAGAKNLSGLDRRSGSGGASSRSRTWLTGNISG